MILNEGVFEMRITIDGKEYRVVDVSRSGNYICIINNLGESYSSHKDDFEKGE